MLSDWSTNLVHVAVNFLFCCRTQQSDFILAESDLRQSLSTREQWFGNAHPLVADTLFALADLMVKKDNSKG